VEAMHKAGKDLTREKLYEAFHGFQNWTGPALHWKGENMGPPISFGPDQRLGNDKIYLAKAKGGKWEKLTDWLSPGS